MAKVTMHQRALIAANEKSTAQVLRGAKELNQRLEQFKDSVQKKLIAAATRASLRVINKTIKAQIPSRYKEARKGVNWRFKNANRKTRTTTAKAGSKVGITRSKMRSLSKVYATDRRGMPGVGIGPNNVHWLMAGTSRRHQQSTGRPTGKFSRVQPAIVPTAFAKSKNLAMLKFKQSLSQGIKREAEKIRVRAKA